MTNPMIEAQQNMRTTPRENIVYPSHPTPIAVGSRIIIATDHRGGQHTTRLTEWADVTAEISIHKSAFFATLK